MFGLIIFFFSSWQDTTTGETLCVKDNPIILEKMDFPDPVIKVRAYPTGAKPELRMSQNSEFCVDMRNETDRLRFVANDCPYWLLCLMLVLEQVLLHL